MKYSESFDYAIKLSNDGKYTKAIRILRKLHKFEPNDAFIENKLAESLINTDEGREEGINLFEKIIETKEGKSKYLAMMKLALFYNSNNDNEKAEIYLRKIISNINNSKELEKIKNNSIYMLALILMYKNNSIDEAENLFLKLINTDYEYKAILRVIYINIKKEEYKKAYSYFSFYNLSDNNKKDMYNLEFFLKYKLGMLSKRQKKNPGYFCKQLLNYNEDEAVNHICINKEYIKDNKHIEYNESLDTHLLYKYLKEKINNMDPTYYKLNDVYVVKCDYIIANINGKSIDKMVVITYPNTKNIITMHPNIKEDEYDYNDVNEENKDVIVKQMKRESQIDKFNRKYGYK